MNNGMKIKVYSNGYGESDLLKGQLTDEKKIKEFIKANEL